MTAADRDTAINLYDKLYARLTEHGQSLEVAALAVVEDYLDGKPRQRDKKTRLTGADRNLAFWSSHLVQAIPLESWKSKTFTLALSRYFAQERTANTALLAELASSAPEAICNAVRYSGLVLRQHSPRRSELDQLAASSPDIAELCRVLDIFDLAYRQRLAAVEMGKRMLDELLPFDMLVYASLYAFEHLVLHLPQLGTHARTEETASAQEVWDAINDLLHWKLKTASDRALAMTEDHIHASVAMHLAPFLFPSQSGKAARHDLRDAFERVLLDQVELNSFISRSADAFSYDDAIRFVRRGDRLEIEEVDPDRRAAWWRDGAKLERLHGYWFYRALDEFVASGLAEAPMGRFENQAANQLAYIQAIRTRLRLTEAYGLEEFVTAESGARVNLFQALLSLELTSAFFQRDFLLTYVGHLERSGDCLQALSLMALEGLADGFHNRFPLTWSDRAAKIANIVGWTVTPESPKGNPHMAAAILDFWTIDWGAVGRRLRSGESLLQPELLERPFIKQGQILVQLPWVVGIQNNSTAAINNLRRLGARRAEARAETGRIEERLGQLLAEKGFRVAANWHPPIEGRDNAGEVDLICVREGVVIVMEVKSSYLRRSQRDAWLHATTTLRQAGQQLRRKIVAVRAALERTSHLTELLGVAESSELGSIIGWIVDTSIECDHERFDGFLKVSLEEVLIALRDDRHLLNDPSRILERAKLGGSVEVTQAVSRATLYPGGFDTSAFVEVIENGRVWEEVCA